MSGGRATLGKRKGLDMARQAGDISAVAAEGHSLTDAFYIECKHVKDLALAGFLFGAGTLFNYWRRAASEAHSHGRLPMLIAKQNGRPALVLLRAADLKSGRLFAFTVEPMAFFRLSMPGRGNMNVAMITFDEMLNLQYCKQYRQPKTTRVKLRG